MMQNRSSSALALIMERRARAARALLPCHEVVAVIASGPSLADWQVNHVADRAHCIATNTSFLKLRRPGTVYGCDGPWWDRYHEAVRDAGHEGWTQHAGAASRYGLRRVRAVWQRGLGKVPGVLHHGANSGYQAINLAYQMKARLIVLIGFDMQHSGGRSHWHGDHPDGMPNAFGIEKWQRNFPAMASDLKAEGVRVVNCSIETALDCFERADVRDVL